VLLGEQSASKTDGVGSNPTVLAFVSVAEQHRRHPARMDRWVRFPPDTFSCPVTQREWRPACRAGETGSSPVQGAVRSGVGRRGNPYPDGFEGSRRSAIERFPRPLLCPRSSVGISSATLRTWRSQVRVLPGILGAEWTGEVPARSHKPNHAGSSPASATFSRRLAQPSKCKADPAPWVGLLFQPPRLESGLLSPDPGTRPAGNPSMCCAIAPGCVSHNSSACC
jgi:hypothetical protein